MQAFLHRVSRRLRVVSAVHCDRRMTFRSSITMCVCLLVSGSAFAVGERISVKGELGDQLRETLCVSMECAADGSDATVSARVVKNQVEVKVLGADGRVRLEQKLPANAEGRLSSTDLVAATSAIFKAIESPTAAVEAKSAPEKAETKKAQASTGTKKSPTRLLARGAPKSRS